MRTRAAAALALLLPSMPCWAQPKPVARQEVQVDFDKNTDFRKVDVGTLVVELWDGRSKDVVCRSKGEALIRSPDMIEKTIDESVRKLFADYPPKPAKP